MGRQCSQQWTSQELTHDTEVYLQQYTDNIDGELIKYLRFADDIVLINTEINKFNIMLTELKIALENISLKMNTGEAKIMTKENKPIILDNHIVRRIHEYIYI